jgi:hypothetical protein
VEGHAPNVATGRRSTANCIRKCAPACHLLPESPSSPSRLGGGLGPALPRTQREALTRAAAAAPDRTQNYHKMTTSTHSAAQGGLAPHCDRRLLIRFSSCMDKNYGLETGTHRSSPKTVPKRQSIAFTDRYGPGYPATAWRQEPTGLRLRRCRSASPSPSLTGTGQGIRRVPRVKIAKSHSSHTF